MHRLLRQRWLQRPVLPGVVAFVTSIAVVILTKGLPVAVDLLGDGVKYVRQELLVELLCGPASGTVCAAECGRGAAAVSCPASGVATTGGWRTVRTPFRTGAPGASTSLFATTGSETPAILTTESC